MTATLFLIPNTLGDNRPEEVLPSTHFPLIHSIRHFFVENVRSARRFLIRTGFPVSPDELCFLELSKRSREEELEACLQVLLDGNDAGIISEAGMPAIADPGAPLVRLAHRHGIPVRPLTGPSSISLALAASGLNGQQFCFHGYLPIPLKEREQCLRELENESEKRQLTQVFMETPYRNNAMLESLIRTCKHDSLLCLACDLSLENEWIWTAEIGEWKKKKFDLNKRPAIFLLYREQKAGKTRKK